MTTPKKASRLGPRSEGADSQPPWAMASSLGQLYFPKSADEARSFATEHGALPVNPDLWPWQADAPTAELTALAESGSDAPLPEPSEGWAAHDAAALAASQAPADAPKADMPPQQPQGDDAPAGMTGGQASAPATPGGAAEEPATLTGTPLEGLVTSCPSPALCFPRGLPDNCSYATCVHGAWAPGD